MTSYKDTLRGLAADRRFIPGIFNYCDQWCGRCDFKYRCMHFAFVKAVNFRQSKSGLMEGVSASMRASVELLREAALKKGLNLSDLLDAASEPDALVPEPAINNICLQATKYQESAARWMVEAGELLSQKAEYFNNLDDSDGDLFYEAAQLWHAVDVIEWHQFRIRVKLLRASASQRTEITSEARAAMHDADGSAKVALLSIDESILAWANIVRLLPEQEDAAFERLLILSRLRHDVEKAFPQARSFIRPGFDEA